MSRSVQRSNEFHSVRDGVREDAVLHAGIEGGSERGRLLSDIMAVEAAVSSGVDPAVAWALCAGPELAAMA